ncbi:MAG: class I SAM-dependent methyltransferase [Saprospiraceae bacterium]|nr:class I SAM-dependent methyltransferase [Saprospiraceae bacterium]
MSAYLDYQFEDSPDVVDTFDELPLWSAAFGLLLLKHLPLQSGLMVLDIGSGAGFPLLELAGRLGASSRLYGLDPWANANERARKKIRNYGLTNVGVIQASAEEMPFPAGHFDLIVSNLGINNFDNPERVFRECHRVLKPQGKLALTTNLNGHWQTFYDIFENTLRQLGQHEYIPGLLAQQAQRGTVASIAQLFSEAGFAPPLHHCEQLEMRFLDGSAFLNHHFVKLGWLASWRELLPEAERPAVFTSLEQQLNAHARAAGGLTLQVPMAYLEAEKTGSD